MPVAKTIDEYQKRYGLFNQSYATSSFCCGIGQVAYYHLCSFCFDQFLSKLLIVFEMGGYGAVFVSKASDQSDSAASYLNRIVDSYPPFRNPKTYNMLTTWIITKDVLMDAISKYEKEESNKTAQKK